MCPIRIPRRIQSGTREVAAGVLRDLQGPKKGERSAVRPLVRVGKEFRFVFGRLSKTVNLTKPDIHARIIPQKTRYSRA